MKSSTLSGLLPFSYTTMTSLPYGQKGKKPNEPRRRWWDVKDKYWMLLLNALTLKFMIGFSAVVPPLDMAYGVVVMQRLTSMLLSHLKPNSHWQKSRVISTLLYVGVFRFLLRQPLISMVGTWSRVFPIIDKMFLAAVILRGLGWLMRAFRPDVTRRKASGFHSQLSCCTIVLKD